MNKWKVSQELSIHFHRSDPTELPYISVIFLSYLDNLIFIMGCMNCMFSDIKLKYNLFVLSVAFQHSMESSCPQGCVFSFCKNSLCGLLQVPEEEWDLWIKKWSSTESRVTSTTALETLTESSIIFILKSLVIPLVLHVLLKKFFYLKKN